MHSNQFGWLTLFTSPRLDAFTMPVSLAWGVAPGSDEAWPSNIMKSLNSMKSISPQIQWSTTRMNLSNSLKMHSRLTPRTILDICCPFFGSLSSSGSWTCQHLGRKMTPEAMQRTFLLVHWVRDCIDNSETCGCMPLPWKTFMCLWCRYHDTLSHWGDNEHCSLQERGDPKAQTSCHLVYEKSVRLPTAFYLLFSGWP